MPYIKIEVTREGVSNEQKQEIIQRVTQVMVEVLKKDPAMTHIVIQEIDTHDWGVSGMQVSELRKKQQAQ
ncbi:MAG: 4-oxalocrotonate tautomerase family protein [Cytophagaceae bacterium]|jgi:4-oxalocrotonate tautomerase|nr:4-oxalocrotonate tautomerase family protein [Cytophagaceae bacterium]